jgi:hypothetical protein
MIGHKILLSSALVCKVAAAGITRQMLAIWPVEGTFERNPIMAAVIRSDALHILLQLAGIAVILWAYSRVRCWCSAEVDFRRHFATGVVLLIFVVNLFDAANNLLLYLFS